MSHGGVAFTTVNDPGCISNRQPPGLGMVKGLPGRTLFFEAYPHIAETFGGAWVLPFGAHDEGRLGNNCLCLVIPRKCVSTCVMRLYS